MPGNTLNRIFQQVRALTPTGSVGAVLARGSAVSFTLRSVTAAIAFLSQLILARILGSGQYGDYIVVITWLELIATASRMGLDAAALRFAASYMAREQWGLLRGFVTRMTSAAVLSGTIVAVALALVVWIFRNEFTSNGVRTFVVGAALIPVLSFLAMSRASTQAMRCVLVSYLPEGIIRPLALMLGIAVLYLLAGRQVDAPAAMAVHVAAASLAAPFGAYFIWRCAPPATWAHRAARQTSLWIRTALPLLFISAMHLVINRTDIIMLGAMSSSADAGIYAVAARVTEIVAFGLLSLNVVLAPMISHLHSRGEMQQMQRAVSMAALAITAITMAGAAILLAGGTVILSWFGEEYVSGFPALQIMLIGQIVNALTGSVGLLMTMTGHQNEAARVFGIAAIVNVILNMLLIPRWGIAGAATATAFSIVLWNVLLAGIVKRRLGINATVFAFLQGH